MGLLTDFVVADLADAQRVGESVSPGHTFGGIAVIGIDGVRLGALYTVLSGTPYTTEFVANFMGDQSFVYAASEDGPWVQLVPHDLTRRIAALDGTELPRVAARWAQTEDVAGSPQVLAEFLEDLAGLARQAVASGKELLLWVCL
jgi:hypothetical protein